MFAFLEGFLWSFSVESFTQFWEAPAWFFSLLLFGSGWMRTENKVFDALLLGLVSGRASKAKDMQQLSEMDSSTCLDSCLFSFRLVSQSFLRSFSSFSQKFLSVVCRHLFGKVVFECSRRRVFLWNYFDWITSGITRTRCCPAMDPCRWKQGSLRFTLMVEETGRRVSKEIEATNKRTIVIRRWLNGEDYRIFNQLARVGTWDEKKKTISLMTR